MSAQKPYLDGEDVYIHFPTGRLTLNEVQQIFSTIPFELDLIDHTDHFAWFSNKPNREHVRSVSAVGETVQQCHPARVLPHVMGIINAFKNGTKDVVKVPLYMNGHRCLIQYYALRDVDGTYMGTIEFTGSVEDILGFYDAGAWSSSAPGAPSSSSADATSGASHSESATSEAQDSPAAPAAVEVSADATSGASQSASVEEEAPQAAAPVAEAVEEEPVADATSSASQTGVDEADDSASDADSSNSTSIVEEPSEPAESTTFDFGTPDATTGASDTDYPSEVEMAAATAPVISAPAEEVEEATPDATSGASSFGSSEQDSDEESESTVESAPSAVAASAPEADATSGASSHGAPMEPSEGNASSYSAPAVESGAPSLERQPGKDDSQAYIKFATGRLTLAQAQQIFSTIPFELDLIDHTDHFTWFSNKPNREHVRSVSALNETVQQCHPARVLPHVMGIINAFKNGTKDVVKVPLYMNGHRCLIQYYALRDIDGTYLGTIEFTGSVEDILGFYEQGAWGNSAPGAPSSDSADATSNASHLDSAQESDLEAQAAPAEVEAEEETPDAVSGASQSGSFDDDSADSEAVAETSQPVSAQPQFMGSEESSEPDAVSGASATGATDDEEEEEPAPQPAVSTPAPAFMQNDSADDEADATTGASAMGA